MKRLERQWTEAVLPLVREQWLALAAAAAALAIGAIVLAMSFVAGGGGGTPSHEDDPLINWDSWGISRTY